MNPRKLNQAFQAQTTEEKEIELRASRKLDFVGELGRKCLDNKDFQKYLQEYKDAEESIVDDLIKYTQLYVSNPAGDVVKYAFTVMRLLTRLQDYRSLINNVLADAAKKPVTKEEPQDEPNT